MQAPQSELLGRFTLVHPLVFAAGAGKMKRYILNSAGGEYRDLKRIGG